MKLMLTDHQVRILRLRAQGLIPQETRRPASVEQVLTEVCGVQAQELPAALMSVHARGLGLAATDIEQERMKVRTIVRTWCMRGTLHLVTAEDARWLVPLLGPVFIANDRRRMAQLGWDEERTSEGLRLVRDEMARLGGLTREEIIRLLKAKGLPNEGQAPVHLIARAASEGMLCQGPDLGKKPTYVPFAVRVGELCQIPHAAALAELAHRYLKAYAPASPADLASWSGLKMSEARQAWQAISGQLVPVENPGRTLWMLKSQFDWVETAQDWSPVVRLLPKFDTYLLGYAKRDLLVAPTFEKYIHPGGGLIFPTLIVDGRGLGLWTASLRRSVLEVTVKPFERLASELLLPIELEAAGLGKFMGVEAVLKIEGLE
jgi:hypothetical protein